MRVLIAPQEFKGTLTAVEAAEAIAGGVRAAHPDWQLDLLPMADGGPGTTDALVAALGGEVRRSAAHDPLMRPIEASWALLASGVAVIECAAASGLLRLRRDELDPRRASSFGTGELVRAAVAAGARSLIVGLGGSATNDGGAGLAQALGVHLLDSAGEELPAGGAALIRLDRIDLSRTLAVLRDVTVVGATDVTNPLCGLQGASAVYGPQKGADTSAVAELDAALGHYADILKRDLGVEVRDRPGAGAAGGLGAGLTAFLRAELRSGAAVVGDAAGLVDRVAAAGLVITGEGRLDGQSAYGKATQHVARLAAAAQTPVVCIAGTLGTGYEALRPLFAAIESLGDGSGALPDGAMAARQLAAAAQRAVQRLSLPTD